MSGLIAAVRVTTRVALRGARAATLFLAGAARSAANAIRTHAETLGRAASPPPPPLEERNNPGHQGDRYGAAPDANFQFRARAAGPEAEAPDPERHIHYPMDPIPDAPVGQHHTPGGKFFVIFRGTRTGVFNSWCVDYFLLKITSTDTFILGQRLPVTASVSKELYMKGLGT